MALDLSRKRVAIESSFPQLTDSLSVESVKIVRKWKNLPSHRAFNLYFFPVLFIPSSMMF